MDAEKGNLRHYGSIFRGAAHTFGGLIHSYQDCADQHQGVEHVGAMTERCCWPVCKCFEQRRQQLHVGGRRFFKGRVTVCSAGGMNHDS